MSSFSDFDLISFEPVYYKNIAIRKVRLRDVAELGYGKYMNYLHILNLDIDEFVELTQFGEIMSALPKSEVEKLTKFDIILMSPQLIGFMTELLGFFIIEEVTFDSDRLCFAVGSSGVITSEDWDDIAYAILRTNFITTDDERYGEIKSKKAQAIYAKILAGRKKNRESAKAKDGSSDLGNVVAKLCVWNPGVSMVNIWEHTVYQVYALFQEQSSKNMNNIMSTNYSVWGGNEFKPEDWAKPIENK